MSIQVSLTQPRACCPCHTKPRPSVARRAPGETYASVLRRVASRAIKASPHTQREIAARLGIDEQRLSRMLRGVRGIDLDLYDRIITECGMKMTIGFSLSEDSTQ